MNEEEKKLEEIWQTWRVSTSSIKELIRTVATETRNEAIDEMQSAGWDAVIDEAEKIEMPRNGGKLNDWGGLMNRLCTAHQNAAARLKEQR